MSFQEAFNGKKILVTGAGRGIGRAVAKRLHGYGAKVYALSKTLENLQNLKAECPNVELICVDISNWEETRNAVSKIEPLDGLVNNGALGIVVTVMDTSPEVYNRLFQTNVKGSMNISQVVAQKMIQAGKGGSIVNISSFSVGRVIPPFATYSMTKVALEMMSKCLAAELGPHKIRVNSVRLGAVDTDMLDIAKAGTANYAGDPDAFVKFMTPRTPIGEVHTPMDEVVNMILFPLSNLATKMTGTESLIDGGFYCS